MKKKPLVAIIISNYNGASITYMNRPILELCLESLQKIKYYNIKIIVADDNSSDDSKKITEKFNVDFVINKNSRGFAKNNNNAIKFSLGRYNPDYVMLLNNDVIIADIYFLNKLVKVGESRKLNGIISPKTTYPDGKLQYNGIYLKFGVLPRIRAWDRLISTKNIEKIEVAGGAALLIKRSVIDRIGLLDENFVMNLEDVDYSLRARRSGFVIVLYNNTKIIHLEHFTIKTLKKQSMAPAFDFFTDQFNYAYFSLKEFNGIKRSLSLLTNIILRTFFTVESSSMGGFKLKIRPHFLRNLFVTLQAIKKAYLINKMQNRIG